MGLVGKLYFNINHWVLEIEPTDLTYGVRLCSAEKPSKTEIVNVLKNLPIADNLSEPLELTIYEGDNPVVNLTINLAGD